jgi:hypothetical protein
MTLPVVANARTLTRANLKGFHFETELEEF